MIFCYLLWSLLIFLITWIRANFWIRNTFDVKFGFKLLDRIRHISFTLINAFLLTSSSFKHWRLILILRLLLLLYLLLMSWYLLLRVRSYYTSFLTISSILLAFTFRRRTITELLWFIIFTLISLSIMSSDALLVTTICSILLVSYFF